jgi:RND family efflux transporter MFP subunit
MKATRSLISTVAFLTWACGNETPAPKEKAATVSNPTTEASLTQVKISAEAFQRLGIETVAAESSSVASTRSLGGEVIAPPGARADVVAPVAGKVLIPSEYRTVPGSQVASGAPLLKLLPIPTGGDLSQAADELRVAEARYEQARAEHQRVVALHNEKLISQRDLERAVADLASAQAARDAARARNRLAQTGNVEESAGFSALTIAAPLRGTLLDMPVGQGQVVNAGTLLFTVADLTRLWVKVAMYAGEIRTVSRSDAATVRGLSSGSGGFAVRARLVVAPLSADPTASSVDLFYQLDAPRGLRPGERVSVTIPVEGPKKQGLTIPLSAVLYDVAGDSWVYVRTDSLVFTRRRIEIANVVGDKVLITRGLTKGTRVVTAGAVELFGTEFGPGK